MKLSWMLVLVLAVTAVLAKVEVDDDEDGEYGTVEVQRKDEQQLNLKNPCNTKKCNRGAVCVLDEGEPLCVCQTCGEPDEGDSKVCSRDNVTYATECDLDRDHCLCKTRQPGCSAKVHPHVRLDYYSHCKELTECPDDEFNSFHLRMRSWLFQIMTTLSYRHELDEYQEMTEQAMHDKDHADAVIWKFCDLDKDPEDRHVTRRELMYIIASLKPMEHCLVPFLNACDDNDDNTITLVEWGSCLKISHEAIVDKCKHHVRG